MGGDIFISARTVPAHPDYGSLFYNTTAQSHLVDGLPKYLSVTLSRLTAHTTPITHPLTKVSTLLYVFPFISP